MQVAFPHCVTCFGHCYPGRAALIADAKNLFVGINRLLATSPSRALPKQVHNVDSKSSMSENDGNLPVAENGVVHSDEQAASDNGKEKEQNNISPQRRSSVMNEDNLDPQHQEVQKYYSTIETVP